jgi:RNA polymerase sigma-70 factor (sigma-E family)
MVRPSWVTAEKKKEKPIPVSPALTITASVEVMHGVDAAPIARPQGVPLPDDLVVRLFRDEAARLVRMARWFVDDQTAAEDLVQEAFIKLAANEHRIKDAERAAAYLRSIVMNLARDYNRRGLVSLRHRPPAILDEPSAEQQATEREDVREVVLALRSLPVRQRDCVVLRYYLDLSVAEIAATLGLSANSVKTHLQRGLHRLSNDLGERR